MSPFNSILIKTVLKLKSVSLMRFYELNRQFQNPGTQNRIRKITGKGFIVTWVYINSVLIYVHRVCCKLVNTSNET